MKSNATSKKLMSFQKHFYPIKHMMYNSVRTIYIYISTNYSDEKPFLRNYKRNRLSYKLCECIDLIT